MEPGTCANGTDGTFSSEDLTDAWLSSYKYNACNANGSLSDLLKNSCPSRHTALEFMISHQERSGRL